MDKNTITGFVLIAIVLIGFSWYSKPSEEQQRAAFVQDSIRKVEQQKAEAAKKQAAKKAAEEKAKQEADTTALFHAAMQPTTATPVVLKNDKVELTLSSKGATVEKAVVKGYKDRFVIYKTCDSVVCFFDFKCAGDSGHLCLIQNISVILTSFFHAQKLFAFNCFFFCKIWKNIEKCDSFFCLNFTVSLLLNVCC